MCGRYHFSAELLDEIRDLTEQKDWKLELGVLDRDIHPGDTAPVIVAAGDQGGSLRVCRQKWGYPGPGGKGLVFNARSESVFEKRMFRESVSLRRAVVPVSWFYEWNKNKEKFTFTKEGSRILFLAGFYGRYEDGDHFVILTTQANASMAPVHSRMPLVLEREQVREWILDSAKTKELLGQEPPQLARDCEYEQQTLF
ncbi:MAG: SOS response-associated peptidase family protein [Enterocloster clostridioformis]|uniref:SOS response-associated peptidase n=1 Tax=Enterocloster clostridioformis TaxID=1531 RepID=UPI0004884B76|nr:SOS response-associated peptidase family protein [Enterocloster clostridioformis]MDY5475749.1 SOS response-associated peptidase family protein [Enterocloster clostridioformis]